MKLTETHLRRIITEELLNLNEASASVLTFYDASSVGDLSLTELLDALRQRLLSLAKKDGTAREIVHRLGSSFGKLIDAVEELDSRKKT